MQMRVRENHRNTFVVELGIWEEDASHTNKSHSLSSGTETKTKENRHNDHNTLSREHSSKIQKGKDAHDITKECEK